VYRPATSLGHQEGRRVFREGPKFFGLCPIFLNHVQHIFPVGENNFLGRVSPLRPPGYGPGCAVKSTHSYSEMFVWKNVLHQGWPNFLTRGRNTRMPGHWRARYSGVYIIVIYAKILIANNMAAIIEYIILFIISAWS